MSIRKVAVVGLGIMGSGIAFACARGGYEVSATDIKAEAIELALNRMTSAMKTMVEAGIAGQDEGETNLRNIRTTHDLADAVANADLVIEAIPERIDLKKQILMELDDACAPQAIFTSNTSSFRISELAMATKRPERVAGTHWMNPPYLLPLVEVIPGANTSNDTIQTVKEFLVSVGKRPILCKDTPGFLVNRMHSALLVEAISVLEQGIASIEDVDMVWTQHLGLRYCYMGPFQTMDSFGLDTELSQYSYLFETLKESKFRPPDLLKAKVRNQELGLKSGKGFYDYTGKNVKSIIRERDKRLIEVLQFLKI